jgi:hypothetical protein
MASKTKHSLYSASHLKFFTDLTIGSSSAGIILVVFPLFCKYLSPNSAAQKSALAKLINPSFKNNYKLSLSYSL